MAFRKIQAIDPVFQNYYQKFKIMIDEYESFVYLTTLKTAKKRSEKPGSYARYLVRALIIASEIFEEQFDKNDYNKILLFLEKLREHPDYKRYNEDENRFPNATINAFAKFVKDNQFISYRETKTLRYPEFIQEELYSEVIDEGIKEGAKSTYFVSKYERNPKLRMEAIQIHGLNCSACGINMETVYGERGKGYIEVHHIKPLYSLEEEMEVNPEKDLLPVCPNCHRILHRKRDEILTVEEVKEIINLKR